MTAESYCRKHDEQYYSFNCCRKCTIVQLLLAGIRMSELMLDGYTPSVIHAAVAAEPPDIQRKVHAGQQEGNSP